MAIVGTPWALRRRVATGLSRSPRGEPSEDRPTVRSGVRRVARGERSPRSWRRRRGACGFLAGGAARDLADAGLRGGTLGVAGDAAERQRLVVGGGAGVGAGAVARARARRRARRAARRVRAALVRRRRRGRAPRQAVRASWWPAPRCSSAGVSSAAGSGVVVVVVGVVVASVASEPASCMGAPATGSPGTGGSSAPAPTRLPLSVPATRPAVHNATAMRVRLARCLVPWVFAFMCLSPRLGCGPPPARGDRARYRPPDAQA